MPHPPHHAPHHPPHELPRGAGARSRRPPPDPVVEILRKLVRHDHVVGIGDLIDRAGRLGRPDVAEILIGIEVEFGDPPPDLALEALESRLRLDGHRRWQQSLSAAAGKKVALIFPLPPHIHEEWIELSGTTILLPSGHHLPHHLERSRKRVIEGTRLCRRTISDFDLILIEAYRAGTEYFGDLEAVDILDRNYVSADAMVHIHLRPHRHHEDVPFNFDCERCSVL